MLKYAISRLILTIPTFLGVTLFSFFLIHLAPGGPVEKRINSLLSANPIPIQLEYDSYIRQLNSYYGFDRPLISRYFSWLHNLVSFELGESRVFRKQVGRLLADRLILTWKYVLIALPACYVLSLIWSLFSVGLASLTGRTAQALIMTVLYTVPAMALALSLKWSFGGDYRYAAICLAYIMVHLPMTTFLMGGALDQERSREYVRTARSKGLGESKILAFHILRNALIPIVSSLSYSMLAFFTGSLFIESVFEIDGIGGLAFLATQERDYSLLMGIVILISVVFMICRFLSDLLFCWIDPRIRL